MGRCGRSTHYVYATMGVRHYMLPITDAELNALLRTPEHIRALVERRWGDVTELDKDGCAIVALTAESGDDPLAFISTGASDDVSGWIGKYRVEDGVVVECEVDMGYGPASYYRNSFLREVARKLEPITVALFEANCDLDWLEENNIYPGYWHSEGAKEVLLQSFERYRTCILTTVKAGQHLLVWTG